HPDADDVDLACHRSGICPLGTPVSTRTRESCSCAARAATMLADGGERPCVVAARLGALAGCHPPSPGALRRLRARRRPDLLPRRPLRARGRPPEPRRSERDPARTDHPADRRLPSAAGERLLLRPP